MTADSVQRDVTIMFTDIVGYSAMIGKNESHALKLLDEHNKTIEPTIKSHHGRIIKHIGDAIFAEFDSPTDAVDASIIFQNKFKERNSLSRREDHIQIRVGLHKGEVVVKDNDLFGNAVNIGSRIESIAPPGGIAISSEIQNSIDSYSYSIRSMGHVKLKNIKSPQQVYKLYLDKNEFDAESENELQQSHIERGIDIIDPQTYEENEIISIGFLYLKNLGSEDDEYFSYGIQEKLISEIRAVTGLSVPSIQNAVKYKENNFPISEIARRLKVNNIIEGSISIHNDDINIDISLLDIDSGVEMWVKHFDGKKNTTGKLIHSIIYSILSHFEIEIPNRISRIKSNERTEHPQALEKYMRGFQAMEVAKSQDDLEKVKNLFKGAFELDIHFIDAHAQYAVTCSKLGNFEEAESILKKSLNIADKNKDEESMAYVFNLMGFIYNSWNKFEQAKKMFEKGLKIQVDLDDRILETKMLNGISGSFNGLADSNSAKEYQMRAIRLKEEIGEDQGLAFSYASLGNTYKVKHNFSESNRWLLKALGKFTSLKNEYQRMKVFIILSSNYIELGNVAKAKNYIEEAQYISRNFDEPLFLGFMCTITSKINLMNDKAEEAIEDLIQAIEYFQIVDSRLSLLQALFDLCIVYIFSKNVKKARSQYDKAQRIIKKYAIEKFEFKFSIIADTLNAIENSIEVNDLMETRSTLETYPKEILYIEWWLLGRSFYQLGNIKNAEECNENARFGIIHLSESNSDKEDINHFVENNFFAIKINEPTTGFKKDEVPPQMEFCPQCGQKTQSGFVFCGGCGNKLT